MADSAADASARGIINMFLNDIGLGALGDWAWDTFKRTGSIDLVHLEIQQRPEYKERFAGRLALRARGFQMTEAEQLAYERSASDLMRNAGMPVGFYDKPADFTKLIANGVSVAELGTRVNNAFAAVQSQPQVVRDAMAQYYGIKGDNALAAMALDVKTAYPIILQHVAAAEAGGYLAQQNIQIGRSLAERIATATGQSRQAIQAGAEELGQIKAAGILDRRFGETAPSVQTGVAASFEGDAQAQADIQRTVDTRVASTAGGESIDVNRYGAAGLGDGQRG